MPFTQEHCAISAPAWGPETLLSGISLALTAALTSPVHGLVGCTQDHLPPFPWFSFTVAILKIPSYVTNEFPAAAASKSIPPPSIRLPCYFIVPLKTLDLSFYWCEYNGIKKNGSCFTSGAWLSGKYLQSSNRSMSSSFQHCGPSFPASDCWEGRGSTLGQVDLRDSSSRPVVLGGH